MILVAADPGLTGALALYDVSRSALLAVEDMPTTKTMRAKKGDKPAIDAPALLRTLMIYRDIGATHFVVEEVGGLPKQSAPNAFSFGFGAGLLRMAAVAAGLAIEPVTPQRWKGAMRVSTTPKQIRSRATEVFPAEAELWAQGKYSEHSEAHLGRAEAALLAAYGGRILAGANTCSSNR